MGRRSGEVGNFTIRVKFCFYSEIFRKCRASCEWPSSAWPNSVVFWVQDGNSPNRCRNTALYTVSSWCRMSLCFSFEQSGEKLTFLKDSSGGEERRIPQCVFKWAFWSQLVALFVLGLLRVVLRKKSDCKIWMISLASHVRIQSKIYLKYLRKLQCVLMVVVSLLHIDYIYSFICLLYRRRTLTTSERRCLFLGYFQ